jgi:Protein of unknown function (DUF1592)/Protein of unknown function (DUF1588)/Protein of unknown function (DUF1595)/Protein of unknown function (DUF1585)
MDRAKSLQPPPLVGRLTPLLFAFGCASSPEESPPGAWGTPTGTETTATVPNGSSIPPVIAPATGGTTPTTPTTPSGTTGPSTSPTAPEGTSCQGEVVTDTKRVVRLSFYQLSRSLHSLLGDELGNAIDEEYQIGRASPVARTFPPLSSPQEGSTINTGMWQKIDLIADFASDYVLEHVGEVTGCGAQVSEECARAFVADFAERAFRRPLTAAETESVQKVYDDVKAIYGTVPESVQYSVYALLQAPQFLYRTELGDDPSQDGPLSAYEVASALSYFLTDGPPDAALLAAAAANQLSSKEQIGSHVDRILQSAEARKNLEGAIFSYFRLDNLATVKIDNAAFTSGTPERPYTGVRESSYREAELFLEHVLWNEPLTALLTSKKSYVNETLAPLYGLEVDGQDENEFVEVDLPENRSGILTQVGFLASNSRPDVPSVVARGLVVNNAMLCQTNPPFPESDALVHLIEEAALKLGSASEREKADYRTTTSPCLSCHIVFDAYGLALDTYDIIGRYRTTDPEGRTIDPTVTLPPLFNEEIASNAVEMQEKIAANDGFDACFSRNMMNWALAEGSQLTPTSCSTQAVAEAFASSDKSFSALLKAVALSDTFIQRKAGVTP